jgi:hypothetical protein
MTLTAGLALVAWFAHSLAVVVTVALQVVYAVNLRRNVKAQTGIHELAAKASAAQDARLHAPMRCGVAPWRVEAFVGPSLPVSFAFAPAVAD